MKCQATHRSHLLCHMAASLVQEVATNQCVALLGAGRFTLTVRFLNPAAKHAANKMFATLQQALELHSGCTCYSSHDFDQLQHAFGVGTKLLSV